MKETRKYIRIQEYLRKRIQKGKFAVGTYLPSEHELCSQFGTTRTPVRKALDELIKDGYIKKEQGKGSKVLERRKALGLLTVKGFSQAADHKVRTIVLQEPIIDAWDDRISFPRTDRENQGQAVYFKRVRYIDNKPIMLEHNWYSENALEPLRSEDFIEGSFFKTLSQEYLIEIMGSEQEIRAEVANENVASNLMIQAGNPILHISIRFKTSKPELNLYSELYCNTSEFPIRNSYFL